MRFFTKLLPFVLAVAAVPIAQPEVQRQSQRRGLISSTTDFALDFDTGNPVLGNLGKVLESPNQTLKPLTGLKLKRVPDARKSESGGAIVRRNELVQESAPSSIGGLVQSVNGVAKGVAEEVEQVGSMTEECIVKLKRGASTLSEAWNALSKRLDGINPLTHKRAPANTADARAASTVKSKRRALDAVERDVAADSNAQSDLNLRRAAESSAESSTNAVKREASGVGSPTDEVGTIVASAGELPACLKDVPGCIKGIPEGVGQVLGGHVPSVSEDGVLEKRAALAQSNPLATAGGQAALLTNYISGVVTPDIRKTLGALTGKGATVKRTTLAQTDPASSLWDANLEGAVQTIKPRKRTAQSEDELITQSMADIMTGPVHILGGATRTGSSGVSGSVDVGFKKRAALAQLGVTDPLKDSIIIPLADPFVDAIGSAVKAKKRAPDESGSEGGALEKRDALAHMIRASGVGSPGDVVGSIVGAAGELPACLADVPGCITGIPGGVGEVLGGHTPRATQGDALEKRAALAQLDPAPTSKSITLDQIIDAVSAMSVDEVVGLVSSLEAKFGEASPSD